MDGIDFWALQSQLNMNATVMASPVVQPWLEMGMRDWRIEFSVRNHDLERFGLPFVKISFDTNENLQNFRSRTRTSSVVTGGFDS